MTITGKCDACRKRKVKCDERKPKCGACQKRDRFCSYSYGKVTAFVAEDPVRLSKHGKSIGESTIQPVLARSPSGSDPSNEKPYSAFSSAASEDDLQVTTSKTASDDKGLFMTLTLLSKHTPLSKHAPRHVRKHTTQQRKRLQEHLKRLQGSSELSMHRLASPESSLAVRYLEILGRRAWKDQPLAMVGSWIESIPARIGKSPVVDLAVEYFVESYAVYRNDTFSTRSVALASKARALKQLQLDVSTDQTRQTYNTALAMKIHFIAEVLMGLKTLYHIIHVIALVEVLRAGPVADFDVDHYWNFIDNTYIDDVTEAMIAGRTTVFDNDFYLETSSPANIPADAPAAFCLSVTMMHVFIQVPRLICLVRHLIEHRDDDETLKSAISLADSLWRLDPFHVAEQVIRSTTTVIPTPPAPEIADIVPDSLHFHTIDSALLLTRYWLLEMSLCAVLEMLMLHFPKETAESSLPAVAIVQRRDLDAAVNMARTINYAVHTCPSFPVLPLRIHTTLIVSIGSWYRLHLRTKRAQEALKVSLGIEEDIGLTDQLKRADRMEKWISDETNRLNVAWGVDPLPASYLHAAATSVAGGSIPEWLPTSVSFVEEEGEMVMKLEYGLPGERFDLLLGENEERVQFTRSSTTANPFGKSLPPSLSASPLRSAST